MGKKKATLREAGSCGKLNEGNLVIDDKEYSFETELSEESLVKVDMAEVGETQTPPLKDEKIVVSTTSEKNKKKREKKKEKKAALGASCVEEKKQEVKKVSKHVREIQEALARQKEAEERKRREDEERLRKEEEVRHKEEELERLAEEAKRRKKDKKKQQLLLKREIGVPLTAKQKDAQRRLEIMRTQFLSSAEFSLPVVDGDTRAKRPTYTAKKLKSHQGETSGAQTCNDIELVEIEKTEDFHKKDVEIRENDATNEDEDDVVEDWDDKSWDDTPVKGAFDDEDTEATLAMENCSDSKLKLSENGASKKNKGKEVHVEKETITEIVTNECDLRSPICCIMGHVDAGKTKLLDCIRGTNVQEGEAGGITQQIGATYFPAASIRERTKELKADAKLNVPGLLVIDTPGHESFTNLRSRGSGLCDIAVLVVDISKGLEKQALESLNLLKTRNTEFIVALNKVDRLYNWKTCRNAPIRKALKQQTRDVQDLFQTKLIKVITQFKEQGLNTELYYKSKNMSETFSIVPTSAISGEGIPDLLLLLVLWTQKTMTKKLTFSSKVQCTVLEVKVIEGHGTTIDVVLVNGVLREGDQIVVCGMQGPIVTTIRALLTPHPMKELRIKGTYLHHKEIKASQGIKITAQGLEHAIVGTGLHVVGPDDNLEQIMDLADKEMDSVINKIELSDEGVLVQASTLGSLEALLDFLKSPDVSIPVSAISIGPVHKKDVMKAGVMTEKKKEYATILAFDVKVTPEAREYADLVGVKIFMADIIYHLFDQFKAYIGNIKAEKKKEVAEDAVFPCVLQIMPGCIINKKDPIILGVNVSRGILKIGTPICIPARDCIDIGQIASIKVNNEPVETATKGQEVSIKILGMNQEERQKSFGRHFDVKDDLVSHISRKSIDILEAYYRDDLSTEDWNLVAYLKTKLKIN